MNAVVGAEEKLTVDVGQKLWVAAGRAVDVRDHEGAYGEAALGQGRRRAGAVRLPQLQTVGAVIGDKENALVDGDQIGRRGAAVARLDILDKVRSQNCGRQPARFEMFQMEQRA